MKRSRLSPLALLAVAPLFLSIPPSATGQELAQLEDEVVLQDYSTSAEITPALEALAKASTPSAAIEAYARGRAAAPDSFELTRAFVHKMVALGAPDLCASQADEVVQKDPSDGLAWAVQAVGRAGDEDYYGALSAIATAARLAPREPFVQRIAGQLLAWYDTKGEPGRLDTDLHQALRDIRRDFASADAFTQEYRAAKQYFEQPENTTAEQPTQSEPTPTYPPADTGTTAVAPQPSAVYQEPSYTVVTPTYTYPDTYIDTGWYWGPTYDTYRYAYGTNLYILPHRHYDCWPYYQYPHRYGPRPCPPPRYGHYDRGRYGPRPSWRDDFDRHSTPGRRATDFGPQRDARPRGLKPNVTPGFKPATVPGRKPATVPGVRSAPSSTPHGRSAPAARPSRSAAPSHRATVNPRPTSTPRSSGHVRPTPTAPRHSASSGGRGSSRGSRGGNPGGSRGGGHGPRGR